MTAEHQAMVDELMARAEATRRRAATRAGTAVPRGIDLTMHRSPSDRVGTYPLQEFFDRHAADPRPWSVEDMLPDYVLADRATPQFPRYTLEDRWGCPPPWMRHVGEDESVCVMSCDVDRPRPNIGIGRRVAALLLLIAAAAIAAWIILAAGR